MPGIMSSFFRYSRKDDLARFSFIENGMIPHGLVMLPAEAAGIIFVEPQKGHVPDTCAES